MSEIKIEQLCPLFTELLEKSKNIESHMNWAITSQKLSGLNEEEMEIVYVLIVCYYYMENKAFLDKKKMPDDYSEKERIKIDYFQELVDTFWDLVLEICGDDEIVVALEGLSFASNGNALIDISMATALLRKKIVDHTGSSNFYVFSPTSVKKFALKGNAKKNELYEALINLKSPGTNLEMFTKILEENREEWITGGGNVNKPLDDMIDATFICLYLNDLKEKS